MDTLNEYLNKIQNEKEEESVDLFNSLSFNPILLDEKIENLDKLDDKELYNIIVEYYKDILNEAFNNKEKNYLSLFTKSKFLNVFIQAMHTVCDDLTYTEKVYCNKIAYDYMTLKDTNKQDKYISTLLLSLSKVINRSLIPGLIGIGLDEQLSIHLALSRYSTFNEITNVKRVNHIIIRSSIKIMTEQRIVNIYEKLFKKVTPLFEGIMYDVYDESDSNKDKYTEEMKNISSIISLVILDILESMETNDIRLILKEYSLSYSACHQGETVRFSMQALGPDYPRVNRCIEYLNEKELIYLP